MRGGRGCVGVPTHTNTHAHRHTSIPRACAHSVRTYVREEEIEPRNIKTIYIYMLFLKGIPRTRRRKEKTKTTNTCSDSCRPLPRNHLVIYICVYNSVNAVRRMHWRSSQALPLQSHRLSLSPFDCPFGHVGCSSSFCLLISPRGLHDGEGASLSFSVVHGFSCEDGVVCSSETRSPALSSEGSHAPLSTHASSKTSRTHTSLRGSEATIVRRKRRREGEIKGRKQTDVSRLLRTNETREHTAYHTKSAAHRGLLQGYCLVLNMHSFFKGKNCERQST